MLNYYQMMEREVSHFASSFRPHTIRCQKLATDQRTFFGNVVFVLDLIPNRITQALITRDLLAGFKQNVQLPFRAKFLFHHTK